MLFNAIDSFAEKSVNVYLSTGRDSIVMLDLFFSRYAGKKNVVHFWMYERLPMREAFLCKLETRYGFKTLQFPILDRLRMTTKSITWRDLDDMVRQKTDAEWIARGYRKDESLSRRGIMKHCVNGLDKKGKNFYPLIDWSKKHVETYVKQKKLFLPIEYQYGFRDITIYKGNALLWLYNNFPADYEHIRRSYPHIEGELIRAQNKLKTSSSQR